MTLQARSEGLYTHGMAGIEYDAITEYLQLDTQQDTLAQPLASVISPVPAAPLRTDNRAVRRW
jgi:hypothetical protein